MIKKILKLTVVLLLSGNILYAGVANDESIAQNPNYMLNKVFFDVIVDKKEPMYDYITYSKRGGFDLKILQDMFKKTDTYTSYVITGKIHIPNNINTKKIYITVGDHYNVVAGCCGSTVSYSIYINGVKMENSPYILTNTKREFGNKYVDFKIEIKKYRHRDTGQWNGVMENEILPDLRTVRFQVAPQKRGFKDKFMKTSIYQIDE